MWISMKVSMDANGKRRIGILTKICSTYAIPCIYSLLAATVFRPNGARRAFPCFDEPHVRAPFRISVFRDRFHIGLSNSIVHTTEDVGFYMGTGLVSRAAPAEGEVPN